MALVEPVSIADSTFEPLRVIGSSNSPHFIHASHAIALPSSDRATDLLNNGS